MDAIEPHWISLLWFAGFATICTIAFLVVAGMFPLRSRPHSARSAAAMLLIVGNTVLLAALLAGTGLYGYAELRWSSLIVVAGLVVLFAPGLFEMWPSSLRDGSTGLIVLVGVQILALAALAKIGGPGWPGIS
jgi:predicted permease